LDLYQQLERLSQLRDNGVLSSEEFDQQKSMLLARAQSTSSFGTFPPVSGAVPTTIGAYDLIELVGEGGMGVVYRGRHRVHAIAARQGGDVAVKLLHVHLSGNAGLVDRFRTEAEALAALDHPNIVQVHDMVEESGRFALVMEWVPGRPLSHLIGRETGPVPWERASRMVRPMLDAIEHAHARGIIHRDLKPENVRVLPDGDVKVLDFGIARVGRGRGGTSTGTVMGTVDYMAPEQYNDARSVDARADVYALGMTLYVMVAGHLPWDPSEPEFGVMQRKHRGDLELPTTFYPAIPPWVVEAIMAALHHDPSQRTTSVVALRSALFPASAQPDVQSTMSLAVATSPEHRQVGMGAPNMTAVAAHAGSPEKRGSGAGTVQQAGGEYVLGRMGPLNYAIYMSALAFVEYLLFIGFVGGQWKILGTSAVYGWDGWTVFLAWSLPITAAALVLSAKRLHDLNSSARGALLLLIVPLNIIFFVYFCVLPGTPGPNQYGPPPG
jgi:serine/threonine protein kinase/uncharacterized membrane protein YhaH (DUF805 family)